MTEVKHGKPAQTFQTQKNTPCVGIIMLDTIFPRIPGDVGNPDTFNIPVRYKKVAGACVERIVLNPDPALLTPFIQAGRDLIREGARALTTSCGFLSLFQEQLACALDVPVFSSSLLQVPMAASVIGKDRKVGIITARKASLTPRHLAAAGIVNCPVAIAGMDDAPEFNAVFIKNRQQLDQEKCRKEVADVAAKLVKDHPDVGAVVLECTNLPPYANAVRQAAGGLPVFDITTLVEYAWSILTRPWG